MCGITGLTDKDNFHLVTKMNNLMRYRGPDDSGKYVNSNQNVVFAMRRLSIVDIETGKQPMQDKDGKLCIVFNGEIYNAPEIRQRLINKRYNFLTKNSDTEVLLNLYKDKSKDMLKYLKGMFAFVIHDKEKKILFGARDNIGIKPFYYSYHNGKFAFASELKSLLVLPWISREINYKSMYHYLSLQFVPAPNSIFTDIKKLPAGHYFIFDLIKKTLFVEKYWDLDLTKIQYKPIDYIVKELRKKLEVAVKRWTLSDVPIACSLSGGLDSSTIVGLLAKSGINNLQTYSLGFDCEDGQQYNELFLARKVADKWSTDHHEVMLKSRRVVKDLKKMIWHLDEPYGGGLPSWYIYKVIGKNVKVALTGTGGDELFSNYDKYKIYEKNKIVYWRQILGAIIKRGSLKEVNNYFKYSHGHFYTRYASDAFKDEVILSNNVKGNFTKTEELIEKTWNSSNTNNPRNAVAYVDFKMQLPEEFLHVTDRFSMAHSVEARVPFLDKDLVEFVFTLQPNIRISDNEPKQILKKTVHDILPKELLSAPKKGFVLPLKEWTHNEFQLLIEEKLSYNFIKEQGLFSPKVYDEIIRPHLTYKKDFTQQIWTILMFQLWHNEYCMGGSA